MTDTIVLRADRWVDVDAGEVRSPASIVDRGTTASSTSSRRAPPPDARGDRPRRRHAAARASWTWSSISSSAGPRHRRACRCRCTACRTTRRTARCGRRSTPRTTLLAGFTTVRNLGLMVKTGGYLLDVALQRVDRPGLGRRSAHHPGRRTRSLRTAATSTRPCSSGWRRDHAAERRRGHRQRRATRFASACATRSVTAPRSSRSPHPAA